MKRFLTLLFFLLVFCGVYETLAFTVPEKPTGWVNDYTGILSASDKAGLENKLESFERATTNEIAVVIISALDGDVIENVAQEIFEEWGIGKEGKNNGVLLLISLSDRKTRIQTGYGVEGDLTDLETSYIQSDILAPYFREENYYQGIDTAVDKMIESLGGEEIVPEGYLTDGNTSSSNIPWETILFFVFIIFQILAAILGRSKSWWHGGVLGGGVALVVWHFFITSLLAAVPMVFLFIGLGLLFDFLVSRAYSHKQLLGQYPWWFGGGRGGGFGGGGFGGFGGGHSGGGGSSGGW